MEKIDKLALKTAIEDTNKIADHLITLYPYLYISSDEDRFGDKSEIKEDIKELKYLSYMLSRELMKIIDNEKECANDAIL